MFASIKKIFGSVTVLFYWLSHENRPWMAMLTLLLGVTLLGIMGAFIKHLGDSYSPTFLAVARNVFGFIPVIIILAFTKRTSPVFFVPKKNIMLLLIRGGSIALAQLCFYLALLKLEFATASTLVFAGPLFLTALSIPILKANVGKWRWLAVIIGFLGIILIMGVGSDLFNIYALLPLGAAFGYALSSVIVKLFEKDVQTATIQLYTQGVTLIAAIGLLIVLSGYSPLLSTKDFFLIAVMGIGGGCGVICLISAYRMTEPYIIAPFEYFGIPLSIYLGWAYFEEFPLSSLFPGVFFIVGAGALIIWREEKNKRSTEKL